jgi:phosphate starvation-inducible protein PhoH and related proteins
LVEKIITLENISLPEFLGQQNQNIRELSNAFPKSKLISRGNQIKIQGTSSEIIQISNIIQSLISHYHKYGNVSPDRIQNILVDQEDNLELPEENNQVIIAYGAKGKIIKPKTGNQEKLVRAVQENDIVFTFGPAGTGKTFLSVALALGALRNKQVKKIIITRPVVEAGENLGFLPGDLKEKIDPYLKPIYDALYEIVPREKLDHYFEKKILEIAPLAYMRGRTLAHAFVLLDEAQNTTPMQMKMFLTRMGPNSKLIINGDPSQIDLRKGQLSGLDHSLSLLKNTKGIKIIEFGAEDVSRHKLVKTIIKAYQDDPE